MTDPASEKLLGETAVRQGLVTPGQIHTALSFQAEAGKAGLSMRLGEILVRTGVMKAGELRALLAELGKTIGFCPSCQALSPVDTTEAGECPLCRGELFFPEARSGGTVRGETLLEVKQPGTLDVTIPPSKGLVTDVDATIPPKGLDPNVTVPPKGMDPDRTIPPTGRDVDRTVPPSYAKDPGSRASEPTLSGEEKTDEDGSEKKVGKYRILEEIGRGGMGIVYKAFDPDLRRICALKVMIAGEDASEEAIARFHREGTAVAKLGHHPGIVPVFDIGKHRNLHFIAMHFVEGRALDDLIEEGEVAPKRAVVIAEKVARALQHAHDHGILHRDIKPANILVSPEGIPQVTDFGLAKDVESDDRFTRTGTTMGSPQYMPPEQADGRIDQIDARSDVYSLGATLYEMLTFEPPFTGATVINVIRKVMLDDPKAPRKINPMVPRDVETICLKCMEKESEKRYLTAEGLADDLQRFLNGESILAKPPTLLARMGKKVRKYRGMVIMGAATLLVLGAVGVFLVLQAVKNQERFEQNMAEGLTEEKKGDYQRSLELYLAAQAIFEDDPLVVAAVARVQGLEEERVKAEKRKVEEAAQQGVWKKNREKIEGFLASAKALAEQDKFSEAQQDILKCKGMELSPEDTTRVAALETAVEKQRLAWVEAQRKQRIREGFTRAEGAVKAGNALIKVGKKEEAAAELEKALAEYAQVLSLDKDNEIVKVQAETLAFETLGKLYMGLRKYESARLVAEKIVHNSEKKDQYLTSVDHAEKTSGDYMDWIKQAREKIIQKDWETAIRYLERAEKIHKGPEVEMELRRARHGLSYQTASRAKTGERWEEAAKALKDARSFSDTPAEETHELTRLSAKAHAALTAKAAKALHDGDALEANRQLVRALAFGQSEEARRLQTEIVGALEKPEGMVYIQAGTYPVGQDADEEGARSPNPRRSVRLKGFYISIREVTNQEFLAFVKAGGYTTKKYWSEKAWPLVQKFKTSNAGGEPSAQAGPASWIDGAPRNPEEPVRGVSWHEAEGFARYRSMRLPSAEEWEVAASWDPKAATARLYPWGNAFHMKKGRFIGDSPLSAERLRNEDQSALGLVDMGGNVLEWVSETPGAGKRGWALKGASFQSEAPATFARCAEIRRPFDPAVRPLTLGFRLAKTPGSGK